MTRILVYEPAFRRIEARLPAAAREAAFALMDAKGVIRLEGRERSPEDAAAEVGWLTQEMFGTPVQRSYFVALLKSPALKWVQSAAAGFDDPVFARLVAKGARLTTNNAPALGMAEYVLWGVLDHFQRGPERRAAQTERRWDELHFREINGSRWLIIGFGAIGQAVAARAAAFGARVTGVRRQPGAHPLAEAMITPDQTTARLPETDVVVLAVPLSPATANLVDTEFLERMKPGSLLVNVGRGGLVDEAALLAALDRGRPEHAVLDVFHQEPLPADSRFWTHPRVSLSAHASALGSGLTARADALFLENLDRYLNGRPLLNEADPKAVLAG
jgi:phosphoglycerate dehydrogenase-like enzyme